MNREKIFDKLDTKYRKNIETLSRNREVVTASLIGIVSLKSDLLIIIDALCSKAKNDANILYLDAHTNADWFSNNFLNSPNNIHTISQSAFFLNALISFIYSVVKITNATKE